MSSAGAATNGSADVLPSTLSRGSSSGGSIGVAAAAPPAAPLRFEYDAPRAPSALTTASSAPPAAAAASSSSSSSGGGLLEGLGFGSVSAAAVHIAEAARNRLLAAVPSAAATPSVVTHSASTPPSGRTAAAVTAATPPARTGGSHVPRTPDTSASSSASMIGGLSARASRQSPSPNHSSGRVTPSPVASGRVTPTTPHAAAASSSYAVDPSMAAAAAAAAASTMAAADRRASGAKKAGGQRERPPPAPAPPPPKPATSAETFARLCAAAQAVLAECTAAQARAKALSADITAREAAQLDATNADDFDAAEALERPLRRSRDELRECRARVAKAESALTALEREMLEASDGAVVELDATSSALVARRDDGAARLGAMRSAAQLEASRAAERIAVERERLALDASRLAADASELDAENAEVEAEIAESAKEDIAARGVWQSKREAASQTVASLREQLRAAEADEADCAARVSEYDGRLELARAAFGKPLHRIEIKREALNAKLRAVAEAKAVLRDQAKARRSERRSALRARQHLRSDLESLQAEHRTLRGRRAAQRSESRLLERIRDARAELGAAEARAEADGAPLAAEAEALRQRRDAAFASVEAKEHELDALRDALKASALRVPALQEAKRRAVEARDFKEAGKLAGQLKALAADETLQREREGTLVADVTAEGVASRVLGFACEEVAADQAAVAELSSGVLRKELSATLRRLRTQVRREKLATSQAARAGGGAGTGARSGGGGGGAEVYLLAAALEATLEERLRALRSEAAEEEEERAEDDDQEEDGEPAEAEEEDPADWKLPEEDDEEEEHDEEEEVMVEDGDATATSRPAGRSAKEEGRGVACDHATPQKQQQQQQQQQQADAPASEREPSQNPEHEKEEEEEEEEEEGERRTGGKPEEDAAQVTVRGEAQAIDVSEASASPPVRANPPGAPPAAPPAAPLPEEGTSSSHGASAHESRPMAGTLEAPTQGGTCEVEATEGAAALPALRQRLHDLSELVDAAVEDEDFELADEYENERRTLEAKIAAEEDGSLSRCAANPDAGIDHEAAAREVDWL